MNPTFDTAHTPGPWRFERPYGDNTRTFAVRADGHGYIVMPHSKTANHVVDAQHEANMHLIAAAPDLLAALERLCEKLDENIKLRFPAKDSPMGQAKAAIAKARGAKSDD